MKKIIYSIPIISALALAGTNCYATTTVMSLPAIGDLLGPALDTAGAFLVGFWPILGVFLGIAVFGWVISKL